MINYDIAAAALLEKQNSIRMIGLNLCKIYIDNPDMLRTGGHKTVEDAVFHTVKYTLKQLDEEMTKFEREYTIT